MPFSRWEKSWRGHATQQRHEIAVITPHLTGRMRPDGETAHRFLIRRTCSDSARLRSPVTRIARIQRDEQNNLIGGAAWPRGVRRLRPIVTADSAADSRGAMTDDILQFATDESFRLKNWRKHRDDERHGSPYQHAADYGAFDGKRFTRAIVFEHFDTSDLKGVISTIKWGYPKGSLPGGGWHAFSDAFRSPSFSEALTALRATPRSADETVTTLNRCVKGVGTATTTKIAYFARLTTAEGPCLIYDSMVRRAIAHSTEPEFADLKATLNRSKRDLAPGQQEHTYGLYITSVIAAAERRGVTPEVVELDLFTSGRQLPSK